MLPENDNVLTFEILKFEICILKFVIYLSFAICYLEFYKLWI